MYWLSFADGDLPKGSQFLGACIVDSSEFIAAVVETHNLGLNPGGEVLGIPVPDAAVIVPEWRYRLLDRKQCEEFDRCGGAQGGRPRAFDPPNDPAPAGGPERVGAGSAEPPAKRSSD